ncbi:MAG: MBL fold metallo-hydrolase, partial [Lentisphaeria bacterium]
FVTVLGSGSKGNCIAIEYNEKIILVDAGFSAKQLVERLKKSGLDPGRVIGILITHEHSDHVKGVKVLTKNFPNIITYSTRDTYDAMVYRDQAADRSMLFMSGQGFEVEDFYITPFPVPHDAADATAYTVEVSEKKVAIATDLGMAGQTVIHHLSNADLLFIESNYDFMDLQSSSRPWHLKQRIAGRIGHLSNADAAKLICDTVCGKTQVLIVGHISEDCNSEDKVRASAIEALASINANHVELVIATQNEATRTFKL